MGEERGMTLTLTSVEQREAKNGRKFWRFTDSEGGFYTCWTKKVADELRTRLGEAVEVTVEVTESDDGFEFRNIKAIGFGGGKRRADAGGSTEVTRAASVIAAALVVGDPRDLLWVAQAIDDWVNGNWETLDITVLVPSLAASEETQERPSEAAPGETDLGDFASIMAALYPALTERQRAAILRGVMRRLGIQDLAAATEDEKAKLLSALEPADA